ncbi:formylglycine-generating enzyme family protein [Oleiagrimonas sp. C23AA]|uniref:formylglycine-generating enzyme family protein n=1 Tax=Oleiagrimonas sp. C23AA TaxID=2719047 RepID=UPI0014219EFE|nr:formylglycine-generating enzyme family protein [Oleiagrimonas sp. C23AA]NII09387.1 SUMF1/EgtB/PvdO family nonheme iron enzyme [Oleiagrimonas sp. C23AA]
MPSSESDRRQRALGGAIGSALLGFALVYHFFPGLLHVQRGGTRNNATPVSGSMSPLMGFEQRPEASRPKRPADAELDAGPPLSLAPSAVIRKRMASQSSPAQAASVAEAPDSPEVAALLKRAREALDKGNLVGGDDSAAALFQNVLKTDSKSLRAQSGLSEVRTQLIAQVEQSLAAGDADGASQALTSLKSLPRSADDVKRLQQSLDSLQQVRPLLAHAAQLMQQGKSVGQGDDNALAVYRQVMQIDPGNAVAEQGLARIQQHSLDQALSAAAQEDFDAADAALARAAEISPDSQNLQDVRGRIEGLRRQRAESLLAQARSALDGGNVKLAQQLAAQAMQASTDVPGIDDFNERLSNAKLYANYKPGQVFHDRFVDMPGGAPAMVVIPTGKFMMGSPSNERGHESSESPQHQVSIAEGFALSRTEITVAQFRDFVRSSGYVPDSVRLGGSSVYDEKSGAMREDGRATWKSDYEGHRAQDDEPVVNVSWNDARAYATWLSKHTGKSYRLASEAQFEYALRAGTQSRYWWGNGRPSSRVENLTGSGDRSSIGRRWSNAFAGYRDGYWGPAPVASFAANPFGLYDMDGNVSEWVDDCWHDNYTRAPRDGSAWVNPGCARRVVRGGSWGSAPDQDRSAFRLGVAADTRSGRVGFRVMREL